jgi:hypothetical protein
MGAFGQTLNNVVINVVDDGVNPVLYYHNDETNLSFELCKNLESWHIVRMEHETDPGEDKTYFSLELALLEFAKLVEEDQDKEDGDVS